MTDNQSPFRPLPAKATPAQIDRWVKDTANALVAKGMSQSEACKLARHLHTRRFYGKYPSIRREVARLPPGQPKRQPKRVTAQARERNRVLAAKWREYMGIKESPNADFPAQWWDKKQTQPASPLTKPAKWAKDPDKLGSSRRGSKVAYAASTSQQAFEAASKAKAAARRSS